MASAVVMDWEAATVAQVCAMMSALQHIEGFDE
jgi:hypothetical protein